MLSTCLSNDSTIVWTRCPFTRGLLKTNHIAWVVVANMYFELQWQSLEVTGIDRFMSISEHAVLNFVNMLVTRKLFELYMYIKLVCSPLHYVY
ncbi:hypothetical protein Hanom_Chr13g01207681 [Helianthus anomalus]